MSEFGEYMQKIKDGIVTGAYSGDGGFLIPQEMPFDKPGLKAWCWRVLGRLFRNDKWFYKGIEWRNLYNELVKRSKHEKQIDII